ncbi:MAG: exodeoxyribonuclease VII small subunit [Coxiella sp. RIFCSPHIGHO2_12_FULL_42_15]|nr:MAG: exodeoxyribonuclease VII small subunit [Coxiella sp. RIFCSPHIGHO2_12_FULL_42_15]
MVKKPENFNFEKSLEELNTLVNKMEKGNLALEQSLQYFEKGVAIIRDCQQALQKAEMKIQVLRQEGADALHAFNIDKNDD